MRDSEDGYTDRELAVIVETVMKSVRIEMNKLPVSSNMAARIHGAVERGVHDALRDDPPLLLEFRSPRTEP
jgi:hypothetical protein